MRRSRWSWSSLLSRIIGAARRLLPAHAQAPAVTVFEGARLITGDGGVIENSAFIVANDRIVGVGRRGEMPPPPGAMRVDLAGKTVMPALVDDHVHMGYRKGTSFSADNYTRENLFDMLDRYAFYGIAAMLETGTGRGDLPYQGARRGASGHALSHRRQRLRHAQCRPRRGDAGQRLWRHHRGGGAPRRPRARRPQARHGEDLGRRPQRHGGEAHARSLPRASSTRRTSTICG